MDYILNFSIYVSQQMHAHISVSGLPVGPGKKKKIPLELESMKLEFHWKKTEQNKATSRTKQSIQHI